MNTSRIQYATFAQRLIAMVIDSVIFSIILSPLFNLLFNEQKLTQEQAEEILQTQGFIGLIDPKEMMIQQIVVLVITVFFWFRYSGTPGKRLLKLKIVDATSGKSLTLLQSVVRYLGYFISSFPMGLGFLWVLFDKKNQAWHDKFANSVVIYEGTPIISGDAEDTRMTTSEPRLKRRRNKKPVIDKDDDSFAA
ncbi:MAG: RDD family protein [Gammaproteobacteria bacterium]|nr:MAG: RDD family protein [Gammaproteobacteria bacterium]